MHSYHSELSFLTNILSRMFYLAEKSMLLKLIITNVRSIYSMNNNRKVIQKLIKDKVKIGPVLVSGSLQFLETSILTNHYYPASCPIKFQ